MVDRKNKKLDEDMRISYFRIRQWSIFCDSFHVPTSEMKELINTSTTWNLTREIKFTLQVHLAAASVFSSFMRASSEPHAVWMSIFFWHSSFHCMDKALSSYAVFCWQVTEGFLSKSIREFKQMIESWVDQKVISPDDISFHDLLFQSFHLVPELISAFWK